MATQSNKHTKFIFVTGGVVSSLGKGIVAASVGSLLESRGLRVCLSKMDPYINVDPGTMNPFQHGEVFVTDDGAETDLDLGHYERFTSCSLTKRNSFSTGQIYDAVLTRERKGEYLGKTVQVIPHITDQIKENIFKASQGADISIVEIGGTVGDIEGQPFLEAIRQIQYDVGKENVLFIHLTLVPYIGAARELKTKPTQHSVKELRIMGIQPDILCLRADREVPAELKTKIASFCNVEVRSVVDAHDSDNIYKVPLWLHEQNLDALIVEKLKIWTKKPDLSAWIRIRDRLDNPKRVTRVALVGKYVELIDAYKSINEALIHAGIEHQTKVDVSFVDSETITDANVEEIISKFEGVIVPGGFGPRGVEGKIRTIRLLRERNIPFLGICLGMQLAAIEIARNVIGLKGANSLELDEKTSHPIIHLMETQKGVDKKGGSMRLGAYPCKLESGSLASKIYGGASEISERHRHRYEFNLKYQEQFLAAGVRLSGMSPDGALVEMMELKDHVWFVGCQFHPELKSRPVKAHPLFAHFIGATLESKASRT